MTLVVDASVLVLVSLWIDPDTSASIAGRLHGEALHAPDHLPAEATSVIRRRRNAGLLTPQSTMPSPVSWRPPLDSGPSPH